MADFETGLKLLQDIHQKEIANYTKEISLIKSKLKHCEGQLAQAHKDNAGLARKFEEMKVKLVGKKQETMYLRELLLRKDVRPTTNNNTDNGVPPKPLFIPVASNTLGSPNATIPSGDGTLSLSPSNDDSLKIHTVCMNMSWDKPQSAIDVSQFSRKPLKLKKKKPTRNIHCPKSNEGSLNETENISDNVNQSTVHLSSLKSTLDSSIGIKTDATLSNSLASSEDDPCGIGDETHAVDLCPVDDNSSNGSLDECYAHSPSLLSCSDTITSPTSCGDNRKRKILQTTLTQAFTRSNKKPVDLSSGCESPGEAESPVMKGDCFIPPTPWIRPSRGSLVDDWSNEHSDDDDTYIHVDKPEEFNNAVIVPEVSEAIKLEKSVTDTEVNKPNNSLTYAQQLARKAGLPMFEHVTVMRKKEDRAKLDGKACQECAKWYKNNDIYKDNVHHLRQTCRHKKLFHPPESDPGLWSISFPD